MRMAASHNVPDVAHQASPRDKCGHNMGRFKFMTRPVSRHVRPRLAWPEGGKHGAPNKKACSLDVGIDPTHGVSDVPHTRQCKYAFFSLRPEKWARFWCELRRREAFVNLKESDFFTQLWRAPGHFFFSLFFLN